MDNFMTEITPVLINALIAIVTALVGFLVKSATNYINNKKDQVSQQIGIDKFNHMLSVAESVYYMIEQEFKNSEQGKEYVNRAKRSAFDLAIVSKFPGVDPDSVRTLRESIVGKIKSGVSKADLLKPVKATDEPDFLSKDIIECSEEK